MKIAAIFYSKTGITRKVTLDIVDGLKKEGIMVDVFELKPLRDYSRPLHLNPRLIYETLIKKTTEITVIPHEPKLKDYKLIILASPIWCGTIAPPIREFIKKYKYSGKKAVCITTSMLPLNYSKKLKRVTEREGKYKVIHCVNVVGRKPYKKVIDSIVRKIIEELAKE